MTRTALTIFCSLACLAIGCGEDPVDGGGGAGGAAPDPYEDVTFEGDATRAALVALLEDQAQSDNERAAWMTLPADGTELPLSTPSKFSWRVGPPMPEGKRLGPQLLLGAQVQELPRARDLLHPLPSGTRLTPRQASTKLNGAGYLLLIADAEGFDIHRVFTTSLEHTPTAEDWAKISAHDPPFEACVVSGTFEDDVIVDGPWDGPWIAFTIKPTD